MATRFVPLTPRIGARVEVAREEVLSPSFAGECLEALERYGVLFFPEIAFTDEEQVAFSENLGNIMFFGGKRSDGSPDPIYKISLDPKENPVGAEYLPNTTGWHIDGTIEKDALPPRASILSALRVSAIGGQTEFCNTYAAYDDLSKNDQKLVEPLRVVHSFEASFYARVPNPSPEELAVWRRMEARRERIGHLGAQEQPLVWQHQSGRRSLVVGVTADHVVDMPTDESRSLLARLNEHATRPQNVYRHEWKVGDVLMWDNCGVMHRAVPYAVDSDRLMHRTTLCGNEGIEGISGSDGRQHGRSNQRGALPRDDRSRSEGLRLEPRR
jgi:alpha-ketoglutarate-dependent taurine dioxygenase